eukprot:CAMPEP_0175142172 /NCGR_PEP_ID=MMETSP0087-20121206/12627_1 /TAXON_ID=136419 /ORGANISM="Unknown Unknown, Strain D1" /LENGTH=652 /DNA_ID=CAMNT_0016425897 /DNA_START=202 /DNA_END=2160 /DNA_ORIENTATION=+
MGRPRTYTSLPPDEARAALSATSRATDRPQSRGGDRGGRRRGSLLNSSLEQEREKEVVMRKAAAAMGFSVAGSNGLTSPQYRSEKKERELERERLAVEQREEQIRTEHNSSVSSSSQATYTGEGRVEVGDSDIGSSTNLPHSAYSAHSSEGAAAADQSSGFSEQMGTGMLQAQRRASAPAFVRPSMMSERAYTAKLKMLEFNRQTDLRRQQMHARQKQVERIKESRHKEAEDEARAVKEAARRDREQKVAKLAEEISECKAAVLKQRKVWSDSLLVSQKELSQHEWEVRNKEMVLRMATTHLDALEDGENAYHAKLQQVLDVHEQEIDRLVKTLKKECPLNMSYSAFKAQQGALKIQIMKFMDEIKKTTREKYALLKSQKQRAEQFSQQQQEITRIQSKMAALADKLQQVQTLLDSSETQPDSQKLSSLMREHQELDKENRLILQRDEQMAKDRERKEYLRQKREALAAGDDAFKAFKRRYRHSRFASYEDRSYLNGHPPPFSSPKKKKKETAKTAAEADKIREQRAQHEKHQATQKKLARKASLKKKIQGMQQAQAVIEDMMGQVDRSESVNKDMALVPMEIDLVVLRSKVENRKKELSCMTPSNADGDLSGRFAFSPRSGAKYSNNLCSPHKASSPLRSPRHVQAVNAGF